MIKKRLYTKNPVFHFRCDRTSECHPLNPKKARLNFDWVIKKNQNSWKNVFSAKRIPFRF